MQIDNNLLTKLEKLSFLEIDASKREEVIAELSQIVSFVDNLSELNTDWVDDKFAMSDSSTSLRADIPLCDTKINQSILKNAPQSQDDFFIVPKIIE